MVKPPTATPAGAVFPPLTATADERTGQGLAAERRHAAMEPAAGIDDELDAIVQRALHSDPAKRWRPAWPNRLPRV